MSRIISAPEHFDHALKTMTPKMRAALLAMPTSGWKTAKQIGASPTTLRAMWDRWDESKGVAGFYSLVYREAEDHPLRHVYGLSSLGIALHAFLTAVPGADAPDNSDAEVAK